MEEAAPDHSPWKLAADEEAEVPAADESFDWETYEATSEGDEEIVEGEEAALGDEETDDGVDSAEGDGEAAEDGGEAADNEDAAEGEGAAEDGMEAVDGDGETEDGSDDTEGDGTLEDDAGVSEDGADEGVTGDATDETLDGEDEAPEGDEADESLTDEADGAAAPTDSDNLEATDDSDAPKELFPSDKGDEATEGEDIAIHGTGSTPTDIEALSIHDENEEASLETQATIPSYYYDSYYYNMTRMRDQGEFGTCWAFAALACVEASVFARGSLSGYSTSSLDLSERHLAYFSFNHTTDPLGNTSGDYSYPLSGNYMTSGGNQFIAMYALMNWYGPAYESTAPYPTGYPYSLSSSIARSHAGFHVMNTRMVAMKDRSDVKRAVMNYGAAAISVYMNPNDSRFSNYYNSSSGAFCDRSHTTTNHDVTIVGWSDSYPIDRFPSSNRPKSSGAWLCKNSWGSSWGLDGYFWLSYETAALNTSTATATVYSSEGASSYRNNYHHDGSCSNGYISELSGSTYANVFTTKANSKGESLKAVSFALQDTNVKYSIQIYANLTSSTKPTSGSKMLATAKTGTTSYAGYYTVNLPSAVPLLKGTNYAVVITFKHANGSNVKVALDYTYRDNYYSFISSAKSGQSLVKPKGGSWTNCYSRYKVSGSNVGSTARIKAYTVNKDYSKYANVANLTVSKIPTQKLVSDGCKPKPTVKWGRLKLRYGVDYTLTYKNNKKVGTATCIIKGKGKFKGTKKVTFKIVRGNPVWKRYGGATALDTAKLVVEADGVFKKGRGGVVIVATANGYWDALAAAGLAGMGDAPVLITPKNSLAKQTAAELKRLNPKLVAVAGGPAAISDATVAKIRKALPNASVQRAYGSTAVETAIYLYKSGTAVASWTGYARGKTWSKTAIVATSNGYWDALSIAPYAWKTKSPIFLTKGTSTITSLTLTQIKSGGFKRVIIVGGTAAVSKGVENKIKATGVSVTRLAGKDAIATSAAIAKWEIKQGMGLSHMAVATSNGYWDALTAAAVCGKQNSVLVLVSKKGDCRAFDAVYNRNKVTHGHVLGGTAAVPAKVWNHIKNAK